MQRENKDDQKKRDQDKKEKALLEARKEAYNERVALAKKVEERRAEEDKKRYDAEAD
jgi:hypothetical protein